MDGVRTLSKYLSGTGPWSRGFATAGYQISSIFTSTTILPLPRTDYQSGLVQTNITLPYNVTLTQQLCSLDATFSCRGFLGGCRNVRGWRTLASAVGTQLTVADAAAGFQTQNSRSLKALVDKHQWQRSWFLWWFSATNMYLMRITAVIYAALAVPAAYFMIMDWARRSFHFYSEWKMYFL